MPSIQSTLNGGSLQIGPREDLSEGDAVVCSLDDTTGVTTYQWWMIGRPEQSEAGSPGDVGPDYLPVDLGTGASATSFTADTDNFGANKYVFGSYIIKLVVNAGQATEATYRVALSRLPAEGAMIYDPRNTAFSGLRFPGAKEVWGDAEDAWAYMFERLAISTLLLRDYRNGLETGIQAGSPLTISWSRELIDASYDVQLTAIHDGTYFRISVVGTKTTTSFIVTFTTDATAADLSWLAIRNKDA